MTEREEFEIQPMTERHLGLSEINTSLTYVRPKQNILTILPNNCKKNLKFLLRNGGKLLKKL